MTFSTQIKTIKTLCNCLEELSPYCVLVQYQPVPGLCRGVGKPLQKPLLNFPPKTHPPLRPSSKTPPPKIQTGFFYWKLVFWEENYDFISKLDLKT